jgi:PKD repeat protein
VTATANAGYSFVYWTEGGTVVSTSASYTFAASANRTLVANFGHISYVITTSASPTAGGSTSGDGRRVFGASVTVTATSSAGYNFVNWTEGGTAVSTSASYTFTASANRTLVANFSAGSTSITTAVTPTVTDALLRVDNTAVVVAGETDVFDAGVVVTDASGGNSSGAPLYYTWTFGDGTGSTRSSVSTAAHVYPPTCGAYTASVTVDNGLTTSTAALTVSVACQLTITKLQAKLNFAQANADSCSFQGTVALPANYSRAGKVLTLNIGGAQVSFTLNSKGCGVSGRHTCLLTYNSRKQTWTFTATLRNGSWHDTWGTLGLSNSTIQKPGLAVTMTVVMLLDNESFAGERRLIYTATQGVSGATAK